MKSGAQWKRSLRFDASLCGVLNGEITLPLNGNNQKIRVPGRQGFEACALAG